MRKNIQFISLMCTMLLAGCVTIQINSPTALPPAPTIRPQPTSQAPTLQPTFTSNPLPTSKPTVQGISQVKIFLIAINDNGKTGKKIGCGDSLVAVEVQIEPTLGILRAALNELFQLQGKQYYGQSGLYNAIYQSNLSIESLNIVNREAVIQLKGNLVLGGVCDTPRAKAQLEQIALQFSTIDRVSIFINGVPLQQLLSGQG